MRYLKSAKNRINPASAGFLFKGNKMTEFETMFDSMQMSVHETAVKLGWWDTERNDGELIALMHSELSEALEALRHGNPPDDKIPQFKGTEAELADVVIRIMDYAESRGLDISGAIVAKNEMNKTRSYRHGKQF